jgi:hypothetical protein
MADGDLRPALRLARPMLQDFAYLAARLSESEQAQWCAVTGAGTFDADACARDFAKAGPLQWVLVDPAGLPIYACGGNEVTHGVLQTWALGTADGWATHGKTITKMTRRLIDAMLAEGYRRIQTVSHVDRRDAHVWYMRGLGMQREGVLRMANADGSDAVMFARVREG